MALPSRAQLLLERATSVLPISDEDLIYKGIAVSVSERLMALKKAEAHLQGLYGSIEALERKVKTEGVRPDDHTLYTDLLEWRAINHEMAELLHIFEEL
jgi:predicted Zn-dependent protease with MMP-like domain